MKELKTHICLKRDTLINWVESNPVLLEGEVAVVWLASDLVKIKIGDGERHFIDLPYVSF